MMPEGLHPIVQLGRTLKARGSKEKKSGIIGYVIKLMFLL